MSINTFNAVRLAGNRMLVTDGTDQRQTVLDISQWESVKAEMKFDSAESDFEAAVKKFFAPLEAAAEAVKAAKAPKVDAAFYVVVKEEVQGTTYQQEQVVLLDHDSAIARMIESGDTSRLVWVGNDKIEITEEADEDPEPLVAEDSGDDAIEVAQTYNTEG